MLCARVILGTSSRERIDAPVDARATAFSGIHSGSTSPISVWSTIEVIADAVIDVVCPGATHLHDRVGCVENGLARRHRRTGISVVRIDESCRVTRPRLNGHRMPVADQLGDGVGRQRDATFSASDLADHSYVHLQFPSRTGGILADVRTQVESGRPPALSASGHTNSGSRWWPVASSISTAASTGRGRNRRRTRFRQTEPVVQPTQGRGCPPVPLAHQLHRCGYEQHSQRSTHRSESLPPDRRRAPSCRPTHRWRMRRTRWR